MCLLHQFVRYKTVEDSSNAHGVAPPPSWDGPDVQSWLAEHAATINGGKVPIPAGDLFEQGFDRCDTPSPIFLHAYTY